MPLTTSYARWMPVGIATVLHLLVDGLCVCCLYLIVKAGGMEHLLAVFLTYNILAFMTQPLTGWWVDGMRHKQLALLMATCLLTIAATVLIAMQWWGNSPAVTMAIAVLLGMGNSLFHVWGGKMTVLVAGNDMRALGIFVSSGVMGLTVGVLYSSWWLLAAMLLLITLLTTITLRLPVIPNTINSEENAALPSYNPSRMTPYAALGILGILSFVMLRSFIGEEISIGMEKPAEILLLLATVSMIGKACGGWLARTCGIDKGLIVCVGITAACMIVRGANSPTLPSVVIGIFAINCTMPMTLYLANMLLPNREGLAFGLLAAVLIPGYLLAKNIDITLAHHFMLSALLLTIAVESGMLLMMGEKSKKVLAGCVVINTLTNVPLNYILLTYGISTGALIIGEAVVLVIEALWYFAFVRQWRKAVIYSVLCNATSFLTGMLIQIIF